MAKLGKEIKEKLEDFFEDVKDFFYWNGAIVAVSSVLGVALLGDLHH